jgi:hypothetical protein
MNNVVEALKAAKPREKAGARTVAHYGFQINASILKVLDLHEAGLDYRAAFDHFDDLMIFDKSTDPDRVGFYQIKSTTHGVVTIKDVVRPRGAGPKPRSYLGKMNHHMGKFADVVACLGFISNLSFAFKLADGSTSIPDHHVIRTIDLHASEIDLIKKTIKDDCEADLPDGSDFLVFERTFLPLEKQDLHVKARLLEHFEQYEGGAEHVPLHALYNTLFRSAFAKTGITEEFVTLSAFYEHKTFCRGDVAAMFAKAASGHRFHDHWSAVQQELATLGMPSREVIALHNDCIRYISARSAGEPGAIGFTTAARNAILANRAAVDACRRVSDLAALLEQWVTDSYDNRRGGSYVEAFEA